MPKTATKTLQMRLFARHSQVQYLGTYIRRKDLPRQCRDQSVLDMMNELIWDRLKEPDLDLARIRFEQSVEPSLAQGLLPVWSWESLIENTHEVQRQRAENLKQVFGRCKILVTIRHPVKLVESLYLQLLKRDNVGAYARRGKAIRYEPIDDWVQSMWGQVGQPPQAHLEYAPSIEMFADVMGRENIGIFLFEDLVTDPERYYRSICSFIGIDGDEAVQHVEGERENERWTTDQIKRLQQIQSSKLGALLFRYSNRKIRRRMLGMNSRAGRAENDQSRPAKAFLSSAWVEKIAEKTREGNQHLAQEYELPLEKYQYPL